MISTMPELDLDTDAKLEFDSPRLEISCRITASLSNIDTFEGEVSDPISLHKYLYADADPINGCDPTGHFDFGIGDLLGTADLGLSLDYSSLQVPLTIASRFGLSYSGAGSILGSSMFSSVLSGWGSTLSAWNSWLTTSSPTSVLQGAAQGAWAGFINDLDHITFNAISPLDNYRNNLWQAQVLTNSWIGKTANGFAWVGAGSLWAATLVYGLNAAGAPTMDIAIRPTWGDFPKFVHLEYGVDGTWQGATGEFGHMWIVDGAGAGYQLTGIPVISSDTVLIPANEVPLANAAYNCFTAVARAVFRGFGGF